MNWFERWFMERIIRREVRQGWQDSRITNLYRMIRKACEREYYEDNEPTLTAYLQERFDAAGQPEATAK